MDPNVALAALRQVFSQWEEWGDLELNATEAMDSLVDLFLGLDEWLTSGGFRPDDWN